MLAAAKAGHESDVARLLALDPSLVNVRTTDGYQTPLHLAVTNGHDGVVAQLLALSPQSSDVRTQGDRTVLHLAAQNGHDKIVARLLIHNPALIDAVTSDNSTALHFAAREGHEAIVVQLLNHRPGLLDLKDMNKSIALHLAAAGGHVKVVVELLARRPSALADAGWMGRTPLFWAASGGHQEVVDLFPLTTDQVHRRDKRGNTLLHLAVGGGKPLKPASIQRIWEMNPDALFVVNLYGHTPFEYAIGQDNEWAIEYFQWKHSLWSIEEALAKVMQKHSDTIDQAKREQRFREVVQGECERPLLLLLPRDCVCLISEYLFGGGWR